MKIGIITFWQTRDNYGQMLQCWALQQFLLQLGHDPYLIRYAHTEHSFPLKEKIVYFIKKLLKCKFSKLILHQKHLAPLSKTEEIRNFEVFKNLHLRKSKKIYYSYTEIYKELPAADCYIVGSDQVWGRSIKTDDGKVFMLQFVPKQKNRISYATSFGTSTKSKSDISLLSKYLNQFYAVSVREKSGVEICKNAGINASLVVDPTLLLNANQYINYFGLKNCRRNQVFVYSLNIHDSEDIGWSTLREFSKQNNLKVVVTPSSGYIKGTELFGDLVDYKYYNIPEWLNMILCSRMVVTTSFHGVMFCLQFHTPFIYIPLCGKYSKGNNRVLDFIDTLEIQIPIYSKTFSYFDFGNFQFDWEKIDEKIAKLQSESADFLIHALHQK